MGKTSNAVKDRYNAKTYDDIRLRVPKGEKERIQAFAEANGETVNGFINRLIAEAMGVDSDRYLLLLNIPRRYSNTLEGKSTDFPFSYPAIHRSSS